MWTPEQRARAAERMRQIKAQTYTPAPKPARKPRDRVFDDETVKQIMALVDYRAELKARAVTLATEHADILRRMKSLTNKGLAEKFEVREVQITNLINSVRGNSV